MLKFSVVKNEFIVLKVEIKDGLFNFQLITRSFF